MHEHYLKIVSRSYAPLEGEAVQLYEYTFNSNRFKLVPPFAVRWCRLTLSAPRSNRLEQSDWN